MRKVAIALFCFLLTSTLLASGNADQASMQKMLEKLSEQLKDNPEAQKLLKKTNDSKGTTNSPPGTVNGTGWIKSNGKDLTKIQEKEEETKKDEAQKREPAQLGPNNREKYQVIKEERQQRMAEEEARRLQMQQKRAREKDAEYLEDREFYLRQLRQKLNR